MKDIFKFPLIVALLLIVGCAPKNQETGPEKREVSTGFNLVGVSLNKSTKATDKFGNTKIQIKKSKDSDTTIFKDNLATFKWTNSGNSFTVSILNNTKKTIRVLWSQGTFFGTDNKAEKLLVVPENQNTPKGEVSTSLIPAKAKIEEVFYPQPMWNKSWLQTTLSDKKMIENFPEGGQMTKPRIKEIKKLIKKFEGKSIRVLIPLEVSGITYDYTFKFKVTDTSVSVFSQEFSDALETLRSR